MKSAMVFYLLALFGAWLVIAHSNFSIFSMAPPEQKRQAIWDLGFWRYAALEARLGSKARPYVRRVRVAGTIFIAGVLLPMILIALLGISALIFQEPTTTGAN